MTYIDFPRLLTDEQVAALLGVSAITLAVWRCRKRYDLPWVKFGRRVRYREPDVLAFIERRLVRPDTDPVT